MFSLKVLFKRIGVFFVVVCLLTMIVFVSINRPKQVKAEAITAVALGAGALIALVASYLSVSGVQITNNGGGETYFEGFINDALEDFKAYSADGQAQINAMFDSSGAFIGNAQDLSFVTSHVNAVGYWQIGKGLTSVLEDFKSWFVNNFSVNSSSSSVLSSFQGFVDDNGFVLKVYTRSGSWLPANVSYNDGIFNYPLGDSGSFTFVSGNNSFGVSYSNDGSSVTSYTYYNGVLTKSIGTVVSSNLFLTNTSANLTSYNLSWYSQQYNGQLYRGSSASITDDMINILNGVGSTSMSLDGVLTDGYDDFQDALDQDLENEKDNADAVIQVGVNDLPAVLTPDKVVPWILGDVVANDLDTTYEGVYPDQKTAEDDKDDEKEFVPEVPDGWVVVDGLDDFFPFCIPFDFYALLDYFDAEPQAPRIEWEMGFGGVFDSETVILDFEDWEPAARIFRIIVVIGFLVFLILKTRDLIRG